MNPVLHASVTHALVEGVGGQDQDEVARSLHTLNQFVLEFASLQLLHINEDAVSPDLQVDLEEAGSRAGRLIRAPQTLQSTRVTS